MMIYCCPDHDQEFETGKLQACPWCNLILKRIEDNAKVPKIKVPKLRMSVYWGRDADALSNGRTIENLGHRPVHFSSKDQLRDHLKRHRVQEAR